MKKVLLLSTTSRRWALAFGGLLGLLGGSARGQALNYGTGSANNVAGTFGSIASTGTAIATAGTDDASSGAQNIGFTFNFNGLSFTQFVLNTNGFIKLGAVAPSSASLYYTTETTLGGDAISSPEQNLLSPFNCNLESSTAGASYQVLTSGVAGNRVCTVQWTNVRDKALTNNTQYARFSFQAKLYEGSDRIEFVYGPATAGVGAAAFRFAGTGIKGSGAAAGQVVLFTKNSGDSWSAATLLNANYLSNAHNYRQTVLPDAGRTYRFDPLTATDLSVGSVYTLGQVSQTFASPHAVQAVVTNNGIATAARTATLTVAGINNLTLTQTVPALAPGTSATIAFAAYALTGAGTNTVTVSIPADNDNTNNTATSQQVVSAGTLAYTDPNPAVAFANGLGSGAAGSLLYAKYRANGTGYVTNVTPTFTAGAVGAPAIPFQVLVLDASGAGGLPGAVLFTSATLTRPATAGPVPVAVPNVAVTGDFYVATKQGSADNIGLAYQTESPLRPATFYFSANGTAFTDLNTSTFPARLALETTLSTTPGSTTAPTNDECATATLLTPATTCVPTNGTTVGATQTLAAITCGTFTGAADDDVWYRFVATGTAHAVTVAGSAGFDAVVDVRGGACPGANIGCADATAGGGTETVTLTGLTVGATYLVRVYSYGATTTGTFSICVTAGSAAVCATPPTAAVGSITSTSAQLTFVPVAGNTSYTVTYAPTGGATTTVTPAPTASPINLTGLLPGTAYSGTFRAVCASGGTAQALPFSFTTLATTVPANDNPVGATALAVNAFCTPTAATNAGATTTPINGYTNPGNCGAAVSPKDVWFRFTTLAGQTAAGVFVSGTVAGLVRVFAAPNVGGPFTQVGCTAGTTTNTQAPPVSLAGLSGNTTYYVSVSGFGSFDAQGTFTICVTGAGAAPCPAVTGLTASNVTATNATLSFAPAAGAASYTVTYTPAGGAAISFNATASPVTLTGLQSGRAYTVSVVTNCTSGQASPAATAAFTTPLAPCPAVANLAAGNLSPTSATLTFNPLAGSTGFSVTYTPQGGAGTTLAATGSPVALAGLTPGTAYAVSVTTTCAAGQASPAATTAFTTPFPPCPAVTNAAVANVTTTGASVSFTPAAGATGYTVAYTPQGGATTTQTATGSPVTLAGLTPATPYSVTIRTNCAAGQASGDVTLTFTTATPCLAVTNLSAGNISTTGATLTFTAPAAGATSFTVAYTPAGGSTATLTATGSPVVLTGLLPGTAYAATVTTNCGGGQASPSASTSFSTANPVCNAPTNLAVGSVTTTGASVSFTPAATGVSYAITYTPQGGAGITLTASGSPVALTGLTPGTAYAVNVVTTCAAGQTSGPVSAAFSTPFAPCPAVTALTASAPTATGATLTFGTAAGAVGYNITLIPQGGTASTQTATGSPVTLTGLLPGTAYAVSVTTSCAAGQVSPAATTGFATLAPAPTNGAAANVTDTGASVSFTPAPGATSYTVVITPQGGTGTTSTVAAPPATFAGLLPNTNYTVTLVANYPGGAASAPLTVTFRTLLGTATRMALAGGAIGVFPNPAHRAFVLRLPPLGTARTAQLVLVNALGQTVLRQTLALTPGGTDAPIEVADFAAGLYTVRVEVGKEAAAARLMVE